jgi:hypothetical protein
MTPARCRYHTYSTYGRGLELLIGAYNYLDLTPLGRQEEQEEPPGRSNSIRGAGPSPRQTHAAVPRGKRTAAADRGLAVRQFARVSMPAKKDPSICRFRAVSFD